MPSWITDAVVVAAITGLLGIIGGRISSSGSVRAAAVQAAAHERELITAPYEALAIRVSQLESETAAQRETIDSQQAEIMRLRDEMEGLRAAWMADMREWESRDSCWQAAWDDLRDNWSAWRRSEEPPPYPVKKNTNNNAIGGGAS